MGSVNKVILVGRLGKDPEMRYTNDGKAVANWTMATDEEWKDKQGQKQKKTEWHRVVAWEKLAENCGQYLAKGRQVFVEGKLQTREWTDKEGVKRYTTEIQARNVVFLGDKADRQDLPPQTQPNQPGQSERAPGADDDVAF